MEKAETTKAVQRMQDYIQGHIDTVISLSDLAKAAGYSKWHAAKMFKELTGYAPFEYIRNYRLTESARAAR